MAILHMQGFDYQGNVANFKADYPNNTLSDAQFIQGFTGGYGINMLGGQIEVDDITETALSINFMAKFPTADATEQLLCGFKYNYQSDLPVIDFVLDANLYVTVNATTVDWRIDWGSISNSGSFTCDTGWHYFKILYGIGTDYMSLHIDGAEVASATDTGTFFDTESVWLSSTSVVLDDFYLATTDVGQQHIQFLLPEADGTYTDFDGTGNHYELVDDVVKDNDVTVVTTNADGDAETYSFGAPDLSNILAVEVVAAMAVGANGAGTTTKHRTRVSSTNYDKPTADAVDSSEYAYFKHLRETNPATAVAWTPTDIDNAEFGIVRVT